jgi:hypothetical protein
MHTNISTWAHLNFEAWHECRVHDQGAQSSITAYSCKAVLFIRCSRTGNTASHAAVLASAVAGLAPAATLIEPAVQISELCLRCFPCAPALTGSLIGRGIHQLLSAGSSLLQQAHHANSHSVSHTPLHVCLTLSAHAQRPLTSSNRIICVWFRACTPCSQVASHVQQVKYHKPSCVCDHVCPHQSLQYISGSNGSPTMYVRGAWYGTCSTFTARLLLPLSCAPRDTVTIGKPLRHTRTPTTAGDGR